MKLPLIALLHVLLIGCGTTNGAGPSSGASPAPGKWVGPPIPGPGGGETRTTIYYGPWQCSPRWMNECQRKCALQGYKLMGCMWLADIKTDWKGRYLGFPVYAGGRYAITHCCCNYPEVANATPLREKWRGVRESFRRKWGEEFGEWPHQGGRNYPGHHIRDLQRGGDPVAEYNVITVPGDIHDVFNIEYPICYKGGSNWSSVGPDRPYVD